MGKEKTRGRGSKPSASISSRSAALPNFEPSRVRSVRYFLQWILLAVIIAGGVHQLRHGLWPFDFDQTVKPADLPRVLNSSQMHPSVSPTLFWGTYRPDLFFGIKHRSPRSLLGGLAWYDQEKLRMSGMSRFRHFCRHQEGVSSFGWIVNDGETFGVQTIKDDGFSLITKWVKMPEPKTGGSWAAMIDVVPSAERRPFTALVSLDFYFTYPDRWIDYVDYSESQHVLEVDGHTEELGRFKIILSRASYMGVADKREKHVRCTSYALGDSTNVRFGWPLFKHFRQSGPVIRLVNQDRQSLSSSRTAMFQLDCLEYPCGLFIKYHSIGSEGINDEVHMNSLLHERITQFDDRFKSLFPQASQSNASRMYKYVLSNMLGGMGYFYGQAVVQSDKDGVVRKYWPSSLFTAVPSRPAFPRGFLWDEAFHHLLLSRWNRQLTLETLGSYLDLMNKYGWIPREIILGAEAEIHVPPEFILQHSNHASPPAWLLTVEQLMREKNEGEKQYWLTAGARLLKWFNWLKKSQMGSISGSYRWRGRNATTETELNPKTLTSGLDDYPRASHPDERERHVDLLCWILYGEKILSEQLGVEVNRSLNGLKELEELHWSGSAFQDYGLHTEQVHLRSHEKKLVNDMGQTTVESVMTRQVMEQPVYRFVPHIGYVSLYPFLLQLIPANSSFLEAFADHLERSELLSSSSGVRSLARNSSMYNKWNTKDDRPYWRGAIWMHFNYLTLRALDKYKRTCESRSLSLRLNNLYVRIRENVLNNTEKVFEQTHTVWEQYNDVDGTGQFSPAFTGWSALVLLIRDEMY